MDLLQIIDFFVVEAGVSVKLDGFIYPDVAATRWLLEVFVVHLGGLDLRVEHRTVQLHDAVRVRVLRQANLE